MDYVLSGGEQRVLQVAMPPRPDSPIQFAYLGVEPTRVDPDRQVTEYRQWAVKCGPPPPEPPPDKKKQKEISERTLTLEPLPGLEPAPDKDHADDCRAKDAVAVQGAAKASLAWSATETWRWIRAGER
jgi:hypothetical protein